MNIYTSSITPEDKLEKMVDTYVQRQLDSLSLDTLKYYARIGLYSELSEEFHMDESNFNEDQVLNEMNMNEIGKEVMKEYLTEEEMELVTDEILD